MICNLQQLRSERWNIIQICSGGWRAAVRWAESCSRMRINDRSRDRPRKRLLGELGRSLIYSVLLNRLRLCQRELVMHREQRTNSKAGGLEPHTRSELAPSSLSHAFMCPQATSKCCDCRLVICMRSWRAQFRLRRPQRSWASEDAHRASDVNRMESAVALGTVQAMFYNQQRLPPSFAHHHLPTIIRPCANDHLHTPMIEIC